MKKVLKFHAAWCGPCKTLSKILDGIETDVVIEGVDVDERRDLVAQYKIRGVPTLVMVEDDAEIKRKVGVVDAEEIKNWLHS